MCIEREDTLRHQLEQQSVYGMHLKDDIYRGGTLIRVVEQSQK